MCYCTFLLNLFQIENSILSAQRACLMQTGAHRDASSQLSGTCLQAISFFLMSFSPALGHSIAKALCRMKLLLALFSTLRQLLLLKRYINLSSLLLPTPTNLEGYGHFTHGNSISTCVNHSVFYLSCSLQ